MKSFTFSDDMTTRFGQPKFNEFYDYFIKISPLVAVEKLTLNILIEFQYVVRQPN